MATESLGGNKGSIVFKLLRERIALPASMGDVEKRLQAASLRPYAI